MAPSAASVSDAELIVLKTLWKKPGTTKAVHAQLSRRKQKWAYTTVATLLMRLREKGFVESEKEGTVNVYRAVVSRDELLQQSLTDLSRRVCDGSTSPLVHALVEARQLSADDIESLRQLVDQLSPKE